MSDPLSKSTYPEQEEEILPPLSEEDKMIAGLCYPLWFGFSPYVLNSKKRQELYLYFHALQGLYYGIVTSVGLFISFILIYLIVFYRRVGNLVNPQGDFSKQLSCGVVAIIIFALFLFGLVFVAFFTLWLGWKASSGSMFRLPIIGKIAYAKMREYQRLLEKEYWAVKREKYGEKVEKKEEDYTTLLPEEPAIQHQIEKIKEIFTTSEEEESLEEGDVEEEVVKAQTEYTSVSPAPPNGWEGMSASVYDTSKASQEDVLSRSKRDLSPLEKLSLIQRKRKETQASHPLNREKSREILMKMESQWSFFRGSNIKEEEDEEDIEF